MKLTEKAILSGLAECGWDRREEAIHRSFRFKDFVEAIAFVNRVAAVAEELNHHPDILISYSTVQLSVFTHSEGGLTAKDFELAGRVNQLAEPGK